MDWSDLPGWYLSTYHWHSWHAYGLLCKLNPSSTLPSPLLSSPPSLFPLFPSLPPSFPSPFCCPLPRHPTLLTCQPVPQSSRQPFTVVCPSLPQPLRPILPPLPSLPPKGCRQHHRKGMIKDTCPISFLRAEQTITLGLKAYFCISCKMFGSWWNCQ